MTDSPSTVCDHGMLRRKCPHCEVIELEALVAAKDAELSKVIEQRNRWDNTCQALKAELAEKNRALIAAGARVMQAEARAAANEKDAQIGRAIGRAAKDLPEGFDLHIELERGAGTVRLYLPDSDAQITDFGCDIPFHAEINAAIDAAMGGRDACNT